MFTSNVFVRKLSISKNLPTLTIDQFVILLVRFLFLSVFWPLSAIFGTGLLPVGNAGCIKCTTNDVISGTRQVLHSSATDQNNAMLLKVVAFTRDIACHFDSVGKTYSGDFTQSRVRLLRGSSLNCSADTSLLGCRSIGGALPQRVISLLKCRCCRLLYRCLSSLSY